MSKGLLRLTIIVVALYFSISYLCAQFFGADVLYNSYTLLFEICVTVVVFEDDSKYFCKFMRWTMLSILASDFLSHLDYHINFINEAIYNYILSAILFVGFSTSAYLAIRHFARVRKVKKLKNGTLAN